MKSESMSYLHRIVRLLLLLVLCQAPVLWAGIPEIAALKDDERLVVTEMYSEPAISIREYAFTSGRVVIKARGKTLGILEITRDEAVMIDRYIECIKRARKANANLLGSRSTPLLRLAKVRLLAHGSTGSMSQENPPSRFCRSMN